MAIIRRVKRTDSSTLVFIHIPFKIHRALQNKSWRLTMDDGTEFYETCIMRFLTEPISRHVDLFKN